MPTTPKRRTAAAVKQAVLQAARDELLDHGYVGVTFEGVARRAGTSKPVLYRRFSNRAAMVSAALLDGYGFPVFPSGTGSLRTDLIAWLEQALGRASIIGASTYRALIWESSDENRQTLDLLAQGWATAFEREVIQSARTRGELGNQKLDLSVLSIPLILLRDQIIFGSIETVDMPFIVDAVTIPVFVTQSRTSQATDL